MGKVNLEGNPVDKNMSGDTPRDRLVAHICEFFDIRPSESSNWVYRIGNWVLEEELKRAKTHCSKPSPPNQLLELTTGQQFHD